MDVVLGAAGQSLPRPLARPRLPGCLPVAAPDLRQLGLPAQLLRVVRAVLDSVGLVARVIADRTDVYVERWADHLPVRVLQHVRRVHRLRLVVVLQNRTRGHFKAGGHYSP